MHDWPEQQQWPRLSWWYSLPIAVTYYPIFLAFQRYIVSHSDEPQHALITAYAYPVLLGIMFAFTLVPRYWLGFVWLAIVSYVVASVSYCVGWLDVLVMALSLHVLWLCQALLLWLRRVWQDKGQKNV